MPAAPLLPTSPAPADNEAEAASGPYPQGFVESGARQRLGIPGQFATPSTDRSMRDSSLSLPVQRAAVAYLVCLSGFLTIAMVLDRHLGFPLDDSWIHQTVARNLVDYGILGYLPGVHSSGSSSLLWTLILVSQYKFLPALNPVLFSALVNGSLIGLIGACLKRLTEREGFSAADSWIFALSPAFSGNFLWLGLLGMEHVLFVALSIAAICLWFAKTKRYPLMTAGGATLLVGLLALTRPEGIFLAPLLAGLSRRAGRTAPQITGLLLVTAIATGISIRVNWLASHTLLPLTMKGRSWLYFGGGPLPFSAHFAFLRGMPASVLATWTSLLPFAASHVENIGLLLLTLVAIGSFMAWIALLLRRRQNGTGTLLTWMLFLTLLYTLILPTRGHGGRYQPLQVLLALPLLLIALKTLMQSAAVRCNSSLRTATSFANGTIVLLVVASTATSYTHWRFLASDGIDQIEQEHGAMGSWVKNNLPAEAVASQKIAVFDIGRIGYGLHGSLTDLGGLTDRAYLPFLFGGRVPDYLQQHRMQYIILPTSPRQPNLFVHTLLTPAPAGFKITEMKTVCFPLDRAAEVLLGTGAAMPCQTAYRLSYH